MTPSLHVRGLTIDPPLMLAPMAGLTHSAFRRLLLPFGGVGCFFTEMLSARSLHTEDPKTSPYLLRTPEERPLCYQLLASEPEEIDKALAVVEGQGAEAVDLNMGCPAPLIRKRGGGSRLMEVPSKAAALVRRVRARTGLPFFTKIRLGETLDEDHLHDFCRMLEEEGADLITVHARLRGEPYGRRPRWDWIGKVKEWVSVPVVGNGSIFSPDDARRCLEASGCDGLMIGRGAPTRPWLFRDIAREVYNMPLGDERPFRPDVYLRFANLLVKSLEPTRRLGRLKEFTAYFAQPYTFGHTLESKVQSAPDFAEAMARVEAFFTRAEAGFDGWPDEGKEWLR